MHRQNSLHFTLFTIFLFVCFGAAHAQQHNVAIKGTASQAAGKNIFLYKYSDRLSESELLLDSTTIDSLDHFQIVTHVNYPTLVVVQIEAYSQSFYVEAGKTYSCHIDNFDWSIDEKQNIHLAPIALPLLFDNISPDDINLQIAQFDHVVDSFITANRVHFDFIFKPQKQYLDSLLALTGITLDATPTSFVERYKIYRLAESALTFGFLNRTKVFNLLIKDQPVRYYDENYMSLFTALFSNLISKGSAKINQRKVINLVESESLQELVDMLGAEPLLRNEQIRELALLLALKEAFYNCHDYSPHHVAHLVEQIGQSSKFDDHRLLAQHLLESFHQAQMQTQYSIPPLPDIDKTPVALEQFRGKWVYVAFVRLNEPASIGELAAMAHFYDTVHAPADSVAFVTIDCDKEFQTMYHFLKNTRHGNRYSWTWLHFDSQYPMLEHLQVVSYPTFILFNPQGETPYTVTPAPSTGFLLNAPWKPRQEQPHDDFFLQY